MTRMDFGIRPRRRIWRRPILAALAAMTMLTAITPGPAGAMDPGGNAVDEVIEDKDLDKVDGREFRAHLGTLEGQDAVFYADKFETQPSDVTFTDILTPSPLRGPMQSCSNPKDEAVCYDYTLQVAGPIEPGTRLRVAVDAFNTGRGGRAGEIVVTDPGGNKECRPSKGTEVFHGIETDPINRPYSMEAILPTAKTQRPDWECPPPEEGTYRITVTNGAFAQFPFTLRARLEKPVNTPDTQGPLMLPDMTPWPPPRGFQIPDCPPGSEEFYTATLDDNAPPDCEDRLRFVFAFANKGKGMYDIHFNPLDLPPGATEGPATQRIYHRDGTPGDYSDNDTNGDYKDVPAGSFVFHESHRHWHHKDAYHIQLFPVSGANSLGNPIRSPKQGICVSPWYMVEFDRFFQDPADAGGSSGCNVSAHVPGPPTEPIRIPLPAGWGDFYGAGVPDNFVDISNSVDGEYILRNTVNPDGNIKEADYSNNVSYAHIRLWTDAGERKVCLLERGMGPTPWEGEPLVNDPALNPANCPM